jgi:hypothetical protein
VAAAAVQLQLVRLLQDRVVMVEQAQLLLIRVLQLFMLVAAVVAVTPQVLGVTAAQGAAVAAEVSQVAGMVALTVEALALHH